MKAKGSIDLAFDSAESAESAFAALKGEAGFGRAKIETDLEERRLVITIEADDVVAFRAAANGLLRNLQVFEDVEKKIERGML